MSSREFDSPVPHMKRVYFVRHGQSTSNAGNSRVGDVPLSDAGKKQAAMIADRCSRLQFDLIISSTLRRAQETAQIIQEKTGKPLEFSGLLIERKHPLKHQDLSEKKYNSLQAELDKNFTTPGYQYHELENFTDLNMRAEKVLTMLLSRKEENIVVVSHGTFLRVIAGHAIFGTDFTAKMCLDLFTGLRTRNTGITIFEYDEAKSVWLVVTWNDHAHLG